MRSAIFKTELIMKHKKIVVAGGTGFIAQAMARYFGKDNHIVLLTRKAASYQNNNYEQQLIKAADGYNITYWRWDAQHVEKHWAREIEGADIVINMAGKSVNCRYTEKNKQEIISSRTQSTKTIGDAIRQTTVPPKLWINASSATIYQHATDKPNDDITGLISDARVHNVPYTFIDHLRLRYRKWKTGLREGKNSLCYKEPDLDFGVQVCKHCENALFEQRTPFTRKIALRIAIALGQGGILEPYYNLLKSGFGGHQGNGRQMYSWLHVEDLCRIVEWCYENKDMEGAYNCCTPTAVTNDEFMKTLRLVTGYKFGLPAPAWLLEAGAALIGTETELLLKSRWVYPARLLQSGFIFKYNALEQALREIIRNTPVKKYQFFQKQPAPDMNGLRNA
jgi:NAD dependent epimerase/dehydratase family enzyme